MDIRQIILEEVNDFDWVTEIPMANEILKYIKEKHYNTYETDENGLIYIERDNTEDDCWFVDEDNIDMDVDNEGEPYNCREHGLVVDYREGTYRIGDFEHIVDGETRERLESDMQFNYRVESIDEVLQIIEDEY